MTSSKTALGILFLAGSTFGALRAADLQPATLEAWERYVHTADSAMQSRVENGRTFLWTDEAPGRSVRLRQGQVPVAPVAPRGVQPVPNGVIHDWVGAVFIPGATVDGLLAVLHDYDRYPSFYKPVVAASRTLACTGADQRFSMIWQHRILFVNAAIEGQYEARDFFIDGRRGYSFAGSTEVQEIENYGKTDERVLPPGQGNGFIWRLHSIARYEERDGGVYFELEALALTRDIPASLRWLVAPLVNHLSINSLTTTLRQTRDAVESLVHAPDRAATCVADRLSGLAGVKASGQD